MHGDTEMGHWCFGAALYATLTVLLRIGYRAGKIDVQTVVRTARRVRTQKALERGF
jgi:hypothetical protein